MYSQLNNFQKVLLKARLEQGLSAYRLSQISGVNRKTILDIEAGAWPNLKTVEMLCSALKISFVINGVQSTKQKG
ncbi:helix-turn-helix domain-containing protein [Veillonella magna]|uniref:Helix-turn-helix transcriptional regulator n=1 Tax=Veillonella magna TaxID=464322 RepID=A0ABS2GFZ9_9FIRM|nr:helix-turn-helix transcriptional regulator [Veillonella magna]MBM6824820.1 helix-turn-helix transcriptional regulator [Veillonella magna]MBM6913101.1 helix-turn-helix transcriptional regulator [Veillonella magna]